MSFESLQFTYTPPPTIPSALRIATVAAPQTASGPVSAGPINPANTVAGLLIAKLANLSATSAYLQAAILAKTAGSGLSFTAASNPNLASALSNLYPGGEVPTGISVEMYSNMLDAEIGLMQLQSAIGNDAEIEPSPQNIADITTATKAFEAAMIGSLGYQNNLAILLRSLKGDQAIQANMQEQLADYPAVQGTTSTLDDGLDISPAMGSLVSNYVQAQSGVYAQLFTSLSTATDVENDIVGVSNFFLSAGPGELGMMVSSLTSLTGMSNGVQLQDLADDMTNSVFISLLSDVSGAANQMDRLAALAITPLQNSTSAAAVQLRKVQALASQVGYITSGGLRGMVQGNSCSGTSGSTVVPSTTGNVSGNQISAAVTSALGTVSSGMNSVLSHLNMASNTISAKNALLQESLRRTMARRTNDQTAQLTSLCSLRNLQSMIGIATGLMTATQAGPSGSTAVTNLQAISQVLSSFQSPSGSSFAVVNGAVIVTPPSLPAISPNVQLVLNNGGAGLVATSNLAT